MRTSQHLVRWSPVLLVLATAGGYYGLRHTPAPSTDPASSEPTRPSRPFGMPLPLGDPAVDGVASPAATEDPAASGRAGSSRAVAVQADTRAYVPHQYLVAVSPGAGAASVAGDHGARLLRDPGPSGYALFEWKGVTAEQLRALLADPRVADVTRNGLLGAAGYSDLDPLSGSTTRLAWHHRMARIPGAPASLSDHVVAVLDTGAAYADEGPWGAEQARSLAHTPIVAPYDFVNDDPEPLDDHQHGTHIATTIGGGEPYPGVAPGVSLMPLKVLDDTERGSELALLDALHWAVDHGAHVVNMSLSFSPWYVPSRALDRALERAVESGVVLVAASGNNAATWVSWPAADPRVIAVGAAQMDEDLGPAPAPYGNRSPALDLLAPGGNIAVDNDTDGLADGLLAESFPLNRPSQSEPVLIAGTSQAAAVVSGAVVHLLHAGADPADIPLLLQASANPYGLLQSPDAPFVEGLGAGLLDLDAALDLVANGLEVPPHDYQVRVLPYLVDLDPGTTARQRVVPAARVFLYDADGSPVDGAWIHGTHWGAENTITSCRSHGGTCLLTGAPERITDERGDVLPLAWGFSVEAVVVDGLAHRPRAAPADGPCYPSLTRSLRDHRALGDTRLAFWWSEQDHPMLGSLAEAGVVADLGSPGATTRPFAALFTPTLLDPVDLQAWAVALGPDREPWCEADRVEVLTGSPSAALSLPADLAFASLDPVGPITRAHLESMVLRRPTRGFEQAFPGIQDPAGAPAIGGDPLTVTLTGQPLASAMHGDRVLQLSEAEFTRAAPGTGSVPVED